MDLPAHTAHLGGCIGDHLARLAPLPCVAQVRRQGMLAAVEFTDAAGLDFAEATADAAREAGVFFRTIGNVLAIAPPYISTPQDIDTVMRTLAQSINAVLYHKAT